MPLGPIIMSPDRLLYSFKREVILRRPEVSRIDIGVFLVELSRNIAELSEIIVLS